MWLAATIAEEQGLHALENLRRSERNVRDFLIERFLQVIDREALDPVERAQCGRILGLLGDPRPGVGVKDGLPDIDWVHIPDDGEWTYRDEKHAGLGGYDISRYPVTYAQFQCFLDAEDGFHSDDHDWFEGFAANAFDKGMHDQAFKYSNHPQESVSWYHAMAFCRWLSWKIYTLMPSSPTLLPEGEGSKKPFDMMDVSTWAVRLPTEFEWEKAARGTDGRVYPYGNVFDASKGNTRDTGIGKTSAVGIFPDGSSPYGVLDMSGNVLEWCLSEYDNPVEHPRDENISSDSNRLLRGGSWSWGRNNVTLRISYFPDYIYDYVGFRVVRAPSL